MAVLLTQSDIDVMSLPVPINMEFPGTFEAVLRRYAWPFGIDTH